MFGTESGLRVSGQKVQKRGPPRCGGLTDQIAEKFLGASPMQNRRVYFDSSPISYATVDRNRARFLLNHGTPDDDPATQSQG
jgi:hypothetical protein